MWLENELYFVNELSALVIASTLPPLPTDPFTEKASKFYQA